MLKKLIKHEFKATYRFYVPVYIALAALVALACIFLTVIDHFDVNELFLSITLPLGAIVGFLAIVFTVLSPYIFICLRFYRSTATREGYLTFTLPASTNQILFSKFLVSFLWAVLTIAVTLFALFVLCAVGFDSEITFMAIRQILKSETFDFTTILSFIMGTSIRSLPSMHRSAWDNLYAITVSSLPLLFMQPSTRHSRLSVLSC